MSRTLPAGCLSTVFMYKTSVDAREFQGTAAAAPGDAYVVAQTVQMIPMGRPVTEMPMGMFTAAPSPPLATAYPTPTQGVPSGGAHVVTAQPAALV